MLLSDLLLRLDGAHVRGETRRAVARVTDRDDQVGADGVFVAVRGARVDGHDRVAGLPHAAAVVVDRPVPAAPGVTVVEVRDTRRALATLAATFHGDPGADLPVVAVTGTNGKTSTTFLLAAMAEAAGLSAGIVGTTGHFIGGTRVPTAHTTPDAVTTQALLARMRDARVGLVAMEASSIGLAAHRCDAIPFRAAIFTNLTRDHLDVHGTMDAYADAKARLFHALLPDDATAVLNVADPAAARMRPPRARTWEVHGAHLRAEGLRVDRHGCHARWVTPVGAFDATLPLLGRHNVDNALGALGGALAAGVPMEACAAGLRAIRHIPGRLQAVPNDRDITVLVDYAHTDDALARVLGELRALGAARILTVFGCGGDRDRGKRPLMGRAAAVGSDMVFVTSDNPRSEDPSAIIADILTGIGDAPCVVEPDRRAAIAAAVRAARPGDIVLLAGKGHETTQSIGPDVFPFDDAAVAAEVLA
jgi:UDP-N-acetylmuramoyl-L-alanyl-D-glutamate--2,6-diaminopimelate ligase